MAAQWAAAAGFAAAAGQPGPSNLPDAPDTADNRAAARGTRVDNPIELDTPPPRVRGKGKALFFDGSR